MSQTRSQTLQRLGEHARQWARVPLGEMQRLLGRPITHLGTHRLALEQWKQALRPPAQTKGRVLITALRNRTWIGVGVYTACVLRQLGYTTTLLYRQADIDRLFPVRHRRFGFWAGVAGIPDIELVEIDSIPINEADLGRFEACARAAAPSALAYDLHLEEQDVVRGDARMQQKLSEMIARMKRSGVATSVQLARHPYHRFILFSGLIADTPTMLQAGQLAGIHTVCLEGWGWRAGHILYNHNSPALEYDISGWLKKIGEWDQQKESAVNKYLGFLEGSYQGGSEWLDNLYAVQRAQVSAQLPPRVREFVSGEAKIFVAGTNVIGDSSMLRRETIFAGQQDWCVALIEHFKRRPDLKLIVRAHPGEVWFGSKLAIGMADVARRAAAGARNILVIEPREPLNTFSLVPFTHVGLVWHSNFGVDMVVRGVPAIAAAKPKYTGMGVVAEPSSPGEYFDLIDRWAVQRPPITPAQVLNAKRYLYIVFKGFSYEAFGRDFLATSTRFGSPHNPEEHDTLYRALVEEAPPAA